MAQTATSSGHRGQTQVYKSRLRRRATHTRKWEEFKDRREEIIKYDHLPRDLGWAQAAIEFGWGDLVKEDAAKELGEEWVEKRDAQINENLWGNLAREAYQGEADSLTVIRWVFEHVDVPIYEWDTEKIPNAGAVAWVKHLQENEAAKAEFFKSVFPKTLPTRGELNAEERFKDDGRKALEIIDRLLPRLADSVDEELGQ